MKNQFTCFLIEDDPDDQEIFLNVLREIAPSVRCITATDGHDAILKLTAGDIKPDLIFADLNMPLMNGKLFLIERAAMEELSTIPVIILSTTSDQRSIEETLQLGATDCITKPDKFSGWGSVIREKLKVFHNAD